MLSKINLPKKTIEKEMKLLFSPIKYGDSGIVICYPACKQYFNLNRFFTFHRQLKKILGSHYKRFLFLVIYLDENDTKDSFIEKFKDEVTKNKIRLNKDMAFNQICKKILDSGKDPYIFVVNAHFTPINHLSHILQLLNYTIASSQRIGSLVFFERNIFYKSIASELGKNSLLMRDIIVIPAYDRDESEYFLKSLAKEWKMKVDNKIYRQILDQFSGYLWLLRESMRYIREHNDTDIKHILNSPGIQLRINTIYNLLTEDEKEALAEICIGNPNIVNQQYIKYFLQIKLIEQKQNSYKLSIKPLESLLNRIKVINYLYSKDELVFFKGKDISLNFSSQELRVLKLLINNRNKLVSREKIGEAIWQKDSFDKYSDWAIDKLISRLRNTLIKLGLPQNSIITKKGQGLIIN